ncbi:hypothetical protein HAHE_34620 [Haloferula helveola]|uniref:DUF3592 domain-containing protein n=1 Tax=Haloferula helveola TaxID=490095 RepID=A0ABN6HAI1_9BACT|nr:hypothetical protein HAHE_34620 [Haloferula helveola]
MAQRTTGARIYLTLIGLLLALAGAVFSWLMWRSFSRASRIDSWPQVPCAILESAVESRRDDPDWGDDMPQGFRFRVRYSYDFEEKNHESDRYRLRGSSWSSSEAGARELVERYPAGSVAECRVSPDDPALAVLEGESRAPGYSLWFPLLFFVGGIGVVIGAWRR